MRDKDNEKKKPPRSKFIILSGVALQMGVTVYLGAYLGEYLDNKYFPGTKTMLITLVMAALVISFYNLLKQLNRINDDSKND